MLKRTAVVAALVLVTLTPMSVAPDADANGTQTVGSPAGATMVKPVMKYTWGWLTGTLYLNRRETRSLRSVSFALTVAAGLCAHYAVQTYGSACALTVALQNQWSRTAEQAYAKRACVKIKTPYLWAYTYTGGYCT